MRIYIVGAVTFLLLILSSCEPGTSLSGIDSLPDGERTVLSGKIYHRGILEIDDPDGIIMDENTVIRADGFIARTDSPAGIVLRGEIRVTGGTLSIEALNGDITQAGSLSSESGSLSLCAKNIYLEESSVLRTHGHGSFVTIISSNVTEVRGIIDVSPATALKRGGDITLLGDQVGILGAKIIASGGAGGGRILVGGDYHGDNPRIPNASFVFVDPASIIRSDSLDNGEGGRVILWSEKCTAFYGMISASGGPEGGDGGFAEVSSFSKLDYQGLAVMSAINGKAGVLLLDPTTIFIDTGAGTPLVTWDGARYEGLVGSPSYLRVATLVAQLNATNVIVDTTSGLGGSGRIMVDNAVSWASGNSLTLDADNYIQVNAAITNTGTGGVVFQAVAYVDVFAGITLGGGNFSSTGTDFDNTGGVINVGAGSIAINHSGNVTIASTLTANAGVNIDATGTLAVTAAINATTGNVTLDSTGVTSLSAAGDITTTTGSVTFGATLAGVVNTTAGNVTTAGGTITYTRAVTLGGAVALSTGAGVGNIVFSSTVNGGSNLTLTAGTGNITLTGAVGAGTRIGVLTMGSATNVTAAAISAVSISQVATSGTTTFNGALNTNGAAGMDLNGAIFNINQTVTTTGTGPVLITNSGVLTIAGAADMNLGGAFRQDGTGTVTTSGDITTTNDNIQYDTAVTLGGAVALSTGAGAGNIVFLSTVNGGSNLTLTAGTGNITLTGAVGTGTRIGVLTMGSATNVTAAAISAVSISQVATSGTTNYNGALNTNGAAGMDLNGAIFNINQTVTTTGTGTVLITNSGVLTIAAVADMNLDGAFRQDGTGTVTTSGDILTSNDGIQYDTVVTLGGNILLDSNTGVGDITFLSSVTGAFTLTLRAGTGTVGLRDVTVNTITFNASSGALTLNGAISVQNDFNTGNVNGTITVNGVSSISTSNDNVLLSNVNNNVTLAAGLTIDTNAGVGNISFAGTINGGFGVTLTAGTGNITLTGAVGGGTRIGVLTMGSATNVTAAAISAVSISQVATSGTTTFNGALNTNGAAGMDLNGAIFNINQTVTTTVGSGGPVLITNSGVLTIAGAADMNLDGAFRQDGTGTVTTSGDITTTNDNIQYDTAVTLGGNVLIDTGAGAGNIIFLGSINGDVAGTRSMTLNAGTGSVTISGPIGNTLPPDNLTISSGAAFDFPSTTINGDLVVTAAGITDTGTVSVATGTSTFTSGANVVTLNTMANNLPVVTINSATVVTLASSNAIDLSAGAAFTGFSINAGPCRLQTALDINGNVSVYGTGTLDVTGSNRQINVSGNWLTDTTATFDSQTGIVVFDGGGTSTLDSGGNDANHNFSSVYVQGNTFLDVINNAIAVSGTLRIAGAADVVDCNDRNFTVGTLDYRGNNGRLDLDGTQGAQNIGAMANTPGTVRYYDGASDGTILITVFSNLTIEGNVRTHSLSAATTVNNTLTVTSGTFACAGFDLDIDIDFIQNNGTVNAGASIMTILRDFVLAGGTFNANTGTMNLSEDFDSSAGGTFNANTGTVNIVLHAPVGSPDTSVINGSNTFNRFICNANNKVITFTAGTLTTIPAAGRFEIDPAGGNGSRITLQSSAVPPGGLPPDFSTGAIPEQWSVDINVAAARLIQYVNVELSWSQNFLVIDETRVTATIWCYNWGSTNPIMESRTIDDDRDGKIDIYVRTAAPLNDDFTNFIVTVDGYLLDTTFTNGCYTGTTVNDDWFIIRLRRDRNASGDRGLDTGATPVWRITVNSTLLAQGTINKFVSPTGVDQTPTDTAYPIVGYSMAVAGRNQVFIHFSEPVYSAPAPAALIPGNFSFAGNNPALQQISSQEYMLTFPIAVTRAAIISGNNVTYTGVVDLAGQALTEFGIAVPVSPYTRRVSDFVLVLEGNEPITFVMYDNTPREPLVTSAGPGYISVFDGTGWVQDEDPAIPGDETLPLTGILVVGAPASILYAINTNSDLRTVRTWYPNPTTGNVVPAYGFVPSFTAATAIAGGGTFTIDFTVAGLDAESLFEFYVRFADTAPGILYARLERPAATDWYRSVRPFAFGCHTPGGQAGSVTVFKNVINPTLGEIAGVHYVLPRAGNVTIQVFTLAGDLVDVIYSGSQTAGEHAVIWDGRNSSGRIVARGLYFIKIVAPDIEEMRKIMVVK